ncbi:MAG: hypothetical protein WA210_08760 [Burkholderiaceae bacterium]
MPRFRADEPGDRLPWDGELPGTPAPAPSRKRNTIGKLLLAGWAIVCLIGLGSLSLGHMAAMPKPDDEAWLTRALLALRRDPSRAMLVHVIYENCSCTRRLFAHLLARGPFPLTQEIVLFVGGDGGGRQSAESAGFEFTNVSSAEFTARYGLESAPVLAAFDAAGTLRYLGGYYSHPAAIAPLDESIHRQLGKGAAPQALPVFGCAVSARLQKAVDPLGIVYQTN